MTLSFALYDEDFVAYQLYEGFSSPQYVRRILRMLWVMGGIALAIGVAGLLLGAGAPALTGLVFGAALILFYPRYAKARCRSHYSKHGRDHYAARFGQTATLVFGEEMEVRDATSVSTPHGSKVLGAVETAKHVFVRLDIGGALILPKARIVVLPELCKLLMDRGIVIQHEIAP